MKKKLLAGLLSLTMLTGQMLPVVAADDADVTVSEDAVIAEEETEEGDVNTDELGEVIVPGADVVLEPDEEVVLEAEGDFEEAEGEIIYDFAQSVASEDFLISEEEIDQATASSYIYSGAEDTYTYTVTDNVDFNGGIYNATTIIAYNTEISYRGRKIKPVEDLNARISSSGLYAMVDALVTIPGAGVNPKDVIKVKFSAKKNKNALDGAYFTAKFSVNSKVAKKLGIKGKSLKALKKAVKQLNKVSKGKENRVSFSITPVNANLLWDTGYMTGVGTYRGWIVGTFVGFSHFRAKLDTNQPDSITRNTLNKWTKLAKSDFTVQKVGKEGGYVYYSVTPKNKNFVGYQFTMRFAQSTL